MCIPCLDCVQRGHAHHSGASLPLHVVSVDVCFVETRGARASTGLSVLCVHVGYKHWSNDSNSNMQPITIKFAVGVGLYLYIILSASCTVDIIDQVELWTPLYTGYIFTPFVKYFTSERLIIG